MKQLLLTFCPFFLLLTAGIAQADVHPAVQKMLEDVRIRAIAEARGSNLFFYQTKYCNDKQCESHLVAVQPPYKIHFLTREDAFMRGLSIEDLLQIVVFDLQDSSGTIQVKWKGQSLLFQE